MPEKVDRCVRQVMGQGHSEQSAFAICNAAMNESEWNSASDETKQIARESLREVEHEDSIVNRVADAVKAALGISESTPKAETADLVESGETPNLGNLMEKAVRSDGTIELKIIEEGWGSSGYYGRDMLERDGAKAFPKGTQMFWDHQTLTEEMERPEGSLNNLAAVLVSDARWNDAGRDGPGLYADAKVFGPYREAVNDLASHIGVSIRAKGETQQGEAKGRRGLIVKGIDEGRSVDFVTQPGAGGKIIELFESKRNLNQVEDTEMSDDQLQEALRENAELKKRLEEREAKDKADEVISEAFKSTQLPSIATGRIRKHTLATIGTYMDDGKLNEDKLKVAVQEAIKDETDYLAQVSEGKSPVTGMGESATGNDGMSDEDFEKQMEGIFASGFGLSESAAKHAARR